MIHDDDCDQDATTLPYLRAAEDHYDTITMTAAEVAEAFEEEP